MDIYFTVGPSKIYPTVQTHIDNATKENLFSLSHRSNGFRKICSYTFQELRTLMDIPKDHQIFFTSSATEAMERIIENCVDITTAHFVNGAFSKRFYNIANDLKKKATLLEVSPGQHFTQSANNIPKGTELLCFTHNETSTGVQTPMEYIYAMHQKHPEALVALDVVSSAPYIKLDFTKLDTVFFSVQKGFGLPAGLGVLIVSPRAYAKAISRQEADKNIGSYHNFPTLSKYAKDNQTIETPNTLLIYLLGKVAHDISEEGITLVRKRLEDQVKSLYDFFDASDYYTPFVTDPTYRSITTPVITTKEPSEKVRNALSEKGLHLTAGFGEYSSKHFRGANFPAHSTEDIERLIGALKDFE